MRTIFSLAILAALTGILASAEASAEVRIADATGGQIGSYFDKYSAMRRSGEKVVVDGPCVSACTMVLGLVPHDRLCVTSQASFGFHAAWDRDRNGMQVMNRPANSYLLGLYPAAVRKWITAHGGLTSQMLYLSGAELQSFVPSC